MRFHGILLVKNEHDVIREFLRDTTTWCDHLWVYDTGSTDGTWEAVVDEASSNSRIIPFSHSSVWYSEGLRSLVFESARAKADEGDWFVRLDADEFYHIPPPVFVRHQLQRFESAIHLQWLQFHLTVQEVEAYVQGLIGAEPEDIQTARRFYSEPEYSEPRLFRYRKNMRWYPDGSFPNNAGVVASARIPIRHYPHRNPAQLQSRVELRRKMKEKFPENSHCGHWAIQDWRTLLVDQNSPGIKFWYPSESLQYVEQTFPQRNDFRSIAKRAYYNWLVRGVDQFRKRYPADFRASPLED
jgi:hypothetical protein